jgi:hypothetical protein
MAQAPGALIVPALTTAPPIEALLMRMPLLIGTPVEVMMKGLALVTLPVTVAFRIQMQLMLLDVLSEATVPEVTLIAHVAANAGGTPPPIISAAKDDDADSRSDRRAKRRRIGPAKTSVGMGAVEQAAEPALNGEND